MDKKIFLDSASTTYINNQVLAEMMPVMTSICGEPNSQHCFGRDAKLLLETARKRVADGIGADKNEVYFTSCGTESNNWAILGLSRANKDKGNHIITSQTESQSLLKACKQLESEGFKVTYLPVDSCGMVKLSALMHEIRKETILVSIAISSPVTGSIQSLNAITRTVKEKGIIFHCDATNSIGLVSVNVKDLNIDAMSISSHKLYGPDGIAALYVKDSVKIDSVMLGDEQENGHRGGDVNLAGAVGFGKAVEIICEDVTGNAQKLRHLREYFTNEVMSKIENVHLLGHEHQRLSNIVTLSFEFVDSEALVTLLDRSGIAVKSYSANASKNVENNYVLKAMHTQPELAQSAIRFSIAKNITKEDLDYVVSELVKDVKLLRKISPLHISVVENKEAK